MKSASWWAWIRHLLGFWHLVQLMVLERWIFLDKWLSSRKHVYISRSDAFHSIYKNNSVAVCTRPLPEHAWTSVFASWSNCRYWKVWIESVMKTYEYRDQVVLYIWNLEKSISWSTCKAGKPQARNATCLTRLNYIELTKANKSDLMQQDSTRHLGGATCGFVGCSFPLRKSSRSSPYPSECMLNANSRARYLPAKINNLLQLKCSTQALEALGRLQQGLCEHTQCLEYVNMNH